MEQEYNVEKSRSLKSLLQKKKTYNKNQEKGNFLFTDKNDDIDSYSYGDQNDTVKVIIRNIFLIFQIQR